MLKHKTWLVQRLNAPVGEGQMGALIEGFSFGGGYRNGGLSKDAMALLRPIFSFDYMGAAEFEFGAVPKALGAMVERSAVGKRHRSQVPGLATFEIMFAHDGVTHTLYAIADADATMEVAERVQSWLLPYGERPDLKESPMLDRALAGDEWCRTRGWFELDNGFFVFLDREMWQQMAALFELEVVV